jgi:hypothetical protein
MNSIYEKVFRFPVVPEFAQKNFSEHFLQADKVMLVMIGIQWIIATFITSISYDTYMYGFIGGGLITFILLIAYRFFKGTQVMRALIGIGMMIFSLIYIQLSSAELNSAVFSNDFYVS